MGSGTNAFAILGIDVGGNRMTGPGPRAVIDRIAPKPPGLGPTSAGINYRQCGVVGEQFGSRQRRAEQQFIQRCQPPAGATYPVAEGRAVEFHPLTRQHLRLPIQRQRVAELADHHMRHQRLGRHAAVERTFRCRGNDHSPPHIRQA
jgi:hypothetical protein